MSKLKILLLAIGLVVMPFLMPNDFWVNMLNLSMLYMILGVGLNVAAGYTGLFSLGQGAFFGIAAYAAALLVMRLDLPFFVAILIAIILTSLVGILLAIPSVRIRGSYLCIATLGFSTIVYQLILNLVNITRGPMGLVGIPLFPKFNLAGLEINFVSKIPWFFIILCTLILLILLERKVLARSRVGLVLKMIREDELAATCCGVNTFRYKVIAFAYSAMYAGVSGALYGFYLSFLTPELFETAESIKVMTMVIVGGFGNIYGIMVAAFLLTVVPEALRVVGGGSSVRFLVYGAVLVITMIYAPEGLASIWHRFNIWRTRGQAKPQVDSPVLDDVTEAGG